MTDIKYDPELPFAVIFRERDHGYTLLGRCSTLAYAEDLVRNGSTLREIIDTTPKPKIPEDAEFITWFKNGANEVAVFANFNPLKPWEWEGIYHSTDSLVKGIGDAEVTVLVRKEETE